MATNSDLKQIFFPVEKVLAEELAPGLKFHPGISHAVVITNNEGERVVVNYCSNKYHLVKNEDVVVPFLEELKKHWDVGVSFHTINSSQFFIDFALMDFPHQVLEKDPGFPKIRLANSYDGRVRYHFSAGLWRRVCSNGLSIPIGETTHIKKLHTPSIAGLVDFSKILEMTSKFIESSDDYTEIYRELNGRRVKDLNYRIEEIIEETRFPPSLEEDVKFRITEEMNQLGLTTPTDWLVYNAFNYQLNHHESLKMKELKREEIDAEVLSYLTDY